MMSEHDSLIASLIDSWCNENLGSLTSSVADERLDELKDHLACVVESRMEQGDSVEDAMEYAAAQFGDVREVREQLTKTLPAFRRWMARASCGSHHVSAGERRNVIQLSLVTAFVLIVSGLLSKDSQSHTFISTVVIAMWVVLVSRQGGMRARARAEWQWIKRQFGF